MPIPEVTNLQFLVLALLLDHELAGRELRALMSQQGASMGRPAFYRLMSRLEEAKFVEGWYELREIDGETVRIRRYKITSAGTAAWQSMRSFVETATPRFGLQGA
jgi:DNA-binding PadR family transcriptional regulator